MPKGLSRVSQPSQTVLGKRNWWLLLQLASREEGLSNACGVWGPERGEGVGQRWCFVIDVESELESDEDGSNVHHFPRAIASPGYSLSHMFQDLFLPSSLSSHTITPDPALLWSSGPSPFSSF